MNRTLLLLSLCFAATIWASAQDAPKPQLRSTPPSPLAPPPAPESETLPLIPDDVQQRERPQGTALAEPKKNKTSEAENELSARIRMRELKTRALLDAKVRAEWDRSRTARTDAEKRDALTAYYTQLYAKVAEFDGSLKKRGDVLRDASIKRITQRNVAPSEFLEPVAEETRSGR